MGAATGIVQSMERSGFCPTNQQSIPNRLSFLLTAHLGWIEMIYTMVTHRDTVRKQCRARNQSCQRHRLLQFLEQQAIDACYESIWGCIGCHWTSYYKARQLKPVDPLGQAGDNNYRSIVTLPAYLLTYLLTCRRITIWSTCRSIHQPSDSSHGWTRTASATHNGSILLTVATHSELGLPTTVRRKVFLIADLVKPTLSMCRWYDKRNAVDNSTRLIFSDIFNHTQWLISQCKAYKFHHLRWITKTLCN